MATKTEAASAIKTPLDMLRHLHESYTFGTKLDAAIAALVAFDPLNNPPAGLIHSRGGVRTNSDTGAIVFCNNYGYDCMIIPTKTGDTTYARLIVGCVTVRSKAAALDHWRGAEGISIASRAHRLTYPAMIEWVAAVCAHRGWLW